LKKFFTNDQVIAKNWRSSEERCSTVCDKIAVLVFSLQRRMLLIWEFFWWFSSNQNLNLLILLIDLNWCYWLSNRFSSNHMIIYSRWFYWSLDVVLSFDVIDYQIHKFLYTCFVISWVNLNEYKDQYHVINEFLK